MIRAEVHQPYFRKFLFVFLGASAFAAYCLYDGLVGYPKKLTIAEAYESLPEEGRREAWKELAVEKGWPPRTPQKPAKDIQAGIGQQFFMFAACGLVAIPAVLKWMSGQGTWIEGDETLIRHSNGQEVPIGSITKIDKKKWEEKGIAKIHYDVEGKSSKFVMDDFKYDRASMAELMKLAEANLTQEQVLGDRLERDKFEAVEEDDEEVNEGDEPQDNEDNELAKD